MNIQAKKYRLIEWITNIQDSKLIDKLVKIADETDWWDEISGAEKTSIEKGLKDLEEGKVVYHSEAKKVYEKYL
jgi:hypothetical protein